MERLTQRIGEYVFLSDEKYPDIINKAYKKLGAYEDTGLSPEQIIEMDKLYSEMAKELGECKMLKNGIFDKWIYANRSFDPEEIKMIEQIEKALGIKLFLWQKTYILRGQFRQFGKTTAECIKELLEKGKGPIDYTKRPHDNREHLHRKELMQIKEKLNRAGIETREVAVRR